MGEDKEVVYMKYKHKIIHKMFFWLAHHYPKLYKWLFVRYLSRWHKYMIAVRTNY